MAMPSATGVESSNARMAEYSVPQMKGSAPKSPATGSQIRVTQKLKPNLSMDSCELRHSSAPMATTIAIRRSAKRPVKTRKLRSPPSRNGNRERATNRSPLQLDLLDGGHLQLHDFFWQRSVPQIRSELLPVSQRPLQEVDEGLRLHLVFGTLVQQQPRKGGNRVDALPRGVRDRDAEVLRHALGRDCGRSRDGLHRAFDEFTRGVLNRPEGDI